MQLTAFPPELFGPLGEGVPIELLELSDNLLSDFPETLFKDFLLYSLMYQTPHNIFINLRGNPLSCCTLSWLYLEGLKYGVPYQNQIRHYCSVTEGVVEEFKFWEMSCSDFSPCETNEGMEDFVAQCESTGPEELPFTTEAPEEPEGNNSADEKKGIMTVVTVLLVAQFIF